MENPTPEAPKRSVLITVIIIIAIILGVCIVLPVCVITILALLGPAIGNTFSSITTSI